MAQVTTSRLEQFLADALGPQALTAIRTAVSRDPRLAKAMPQRAIISWALTAIKHSYDGPIPGQRDQWLNVRKTEDGFTGQLHDGQQVQQLSGDLLEIVAGLAVALELQPEASDDLTGTTATRLGKSLDSMIGVRLLRKELELQDQLCKALSLIPPGKPSGPQAHDYTHVLDDKNIQKGYSLQVHHAPESGTMKASVYHRGEQVGSVNATHSGSNLEIEDASIAPAHRNKGLGISLYEGVMAHGYHQGAKQVVGGVHSTMAGRVHNALARKHGLDYQQAPTPFRQLASPEPGPYDAKLGPYSYTLKDELNPNRPSSSNGRDLDSTQVPPSNSNGTQLGQKLQSKGPEFAKALPRDDQENKEFADNETVLQDWRLEHGREIPGTTVPIGPGTDKKGQPVKDTKARQDRISQAQHENSRRFGAGYADPAKPRVHDADQLWEDIGLETSNDALRSVPPLMTPTGPVHFGVGDHPGQVAVTVPMHDLDAEGNWPPRSGTPWSPTGHNALTFRYPYVGAIGSVGGQGMNFDPRFEMAPATPRPGQHDWATLLHNAMDRLRPHTQLINDHLARHLPKQAVLNKAELEQLVLKKAGSAGWLPAFRHEGTGEVIPCPEGYHDLNVLPNGIDQGYSTGFVDPQGTYYSREDTKARLGLVGTNSGALWAAQKLGKGWPVDDRENSLNAAGHLVMQDHLRENFNEQELGVQKIPMPKNLATQDASKLRAQGAHVSNNGATPQGWRSVPHAGGLDIPYTRIEAEGRDGREEIDSKLSSITGGWQDDPDDPAVGHSFRNADARRNDRRTWQAIDSATHHQAFPIPDLEHEGSIYSFDHTFDTSTSTGGAPDHSGRIVEIRSRGAYEPDLSRTTWHGWWDPQKMDWHAIAGGRRSVDPDIAALHQHLSDYFTKNPLAKKMAKAQPPHAANQVLSDQLQETQGFQPTPTSPIQPDDFVQMQHPQMVTARGPHRVKTNPQGRSYWHVSLASDPDAGPMVNYLVEAHGGDQAHHAAVIEHQKRYPDYDLMWGNQAGQVADIAHYRSRVRHVDLTTPDTADLPLNKNRPGPTYPKLGFPDDRRETDIVNGPRQAEIKSRGQALSARAIAPHHVHWNLPAGTDPQEMGESIRQAGQHVHGALGSVMAGPVPGAHAHGETRRRQAYNSLNPDLQEENSSLVDSKALPAVQLHENVHGLLNRVAMKHGQQARQNLAAHMWAWTTYRAPAAAHAVQESLKRFYAFQPGQLPFEEFLATTLNIANSPADRKDLQARLGINDDQMRLVHTAFNTAHQHMLEGGKHADHRWLDPQSFRNFLQDHQRNAAPGMGVRPDQLEMLPFLTTTPREQQRAQAQAAPPRRHFLDDQRTISKAQEPHAASQVASDALQEQGFQPTGLEDKVALLPKQTFTVHVYRDPDNSGDRQTYLVNASHLEQAEQAALTHHMSIWPEHANLPTVRAAAAHGVFGHIDQGNDLRDPSTARPAPSRGPWEPDLALHKAQEPHPANQVLSDQLQETQGFQPDRVGAPNRLGALGSGDRVPIKGIMRKPHHVTVADGDLGHTTYILNAQDARQAEAAALLHHNTIRGYSPGSNWAGIPLDAGDVIVGQTGVGMPPAEWHPYYLPTTEVDLRENVGQDAGFPIHKAEPQDLNNHHVLWDQLLQEGWHSYPDDNARNHGTPPHTQRLLNPAVYGPDGRGIGDAGQADHRGSKHQLPHGTITMIMTHGPGVTHGPNAWTGQPQFYNYQVAQTADQTRLSTAYVDHTKVDPERRMAVGDWLPPAPPRNAEDDALRARGSGTQVSMTNNGQPVRKALPSREESSRNAAGHLVTQDHLRETFGRESSVDPIENHFDPNPMVNNGPPGIPLIGTNRRGKPTGLPLTSSAFSDGKPIPQARRDRINEARHFNAVVTRGQPHVEGDREDDFDSVDAQILNQHARPPDFGNLSFQWHSPAGHAEFPGNAADAYAGEERLVLPATPTLTGNPIDPPARPDSTDDRVEDYGGDYQQEMEAARHRDRPSLQELDYGKEAARRKPRFIVAWGPQGTHSAHAVNIDGQVTHHWGEEDPDVLTHLQNHVRTITPERMEPMAGQMDRPSFLKMEKAWPKDEAENQANRGGFPGGADHQVMEDSLLDRGAQRKEFSPGEVTTFDSAGEVPMARPHRADGKPMTPTQAMGLRGTKRTTAANRANERATSDLIGRHTPNLDNEGFANEVLQHVGPIPAFQDPRDGQSYHFAYSHSSGGHTRYHADGTEQTYPAGTYVEARRPTGFAHSVYHLDPSGKVTPVWQQSDMYGNATPQHAGLHQHLQDFITANPHVIKSELSKGWPKDEAQNQENLQGFPSLNPVAEDQLMDHGLGTKTASSDVKHTASPKHADPDARMEQAHRLLHTVDRNRAQNASITDEQGRQMRWGSAWSDADGPMDGQVFAAEVLTDLHPLPVFPGMSFGLRQLDENGAPHYDPYSETGESQTRIPGGGPTLTAYDEQGDQAHWRLGEDGGPRLIAGNPSQELHQHIVNHYRDANRFFKSEALAKALEMDPEDQEMLGYNPPQAFDFAAGVESLRAKRMGTGTIRQDPGKRLRDAAYRVSPEVKARNASPEGKAMRQAQNLTYRAKPEAQAASVARWQDPQVRATANQQAQARRAQARVSAGKPPLVRVSSLSPEAAAAHIRAQNAAKQKAYRDRKRGTVKSEPLSIGQLLRKGWPRSERENSANAAVHSVMEDQLLEQGMKRTVHGVFPNTTGVSQDDAGVPRPAAKIGQPPLGDATIDEQGTRIREARMANRAQTQRKDPFMDPLLADHTGPDDQYPANIEPHGYRYNPDRGVTVEEDERRVPRQQGSSSFPRTMVGPPDGSFTGASRIPAPSISQQLNAKEGRFWHRLGEQADEAAKKSRVQNGKQVMQVSKLPPEIADKMVKGWPKDEQENQQNAAGHLVTQDHLRETFGNEEAIEHGDVRPPLRHYLNDTDMMFTDVPRDQVQRVYEAADANTEQNLSNNDEPPLGPGAIPASSYTQPAVPFGGDSHSSINQIDDDRRGDRNFWQRLGRSVGINKMEKAWPKGATKTKAPVKKVEEPGATAQPRKQLEPIAPQGPELQPSISGIAKKPPKPGVPQ